MKAIVLAGGKGTRLAPYYTYILPKPLMPIDHMPILEVLLRQMKAAGVDEVTLTVGHLAGLLKTFFQDGRQWDLNIFSSYEERPLGTAGALASVQGLEDTFMVTNGDVLTNLDFRRLIDYHKTHGGIATIASHQRQVKIDYGVIKTNGDIVVAGYDEKPVIEYVVSMGVYIFEPAVLKYIPCNQYLDFPDLVLKLIAAGEKVISYAFDGYWMDLGRPDDYLQANQDFDTMKLEFLPED
jgi:NDP-sugar pyrophosphorylase family protein